MKSMLSLATGGPETLVLTELPTPEPEPSQIRIQVKAAGVNFPDLLIIQDLYQFKPPRPFAPGGEVAGVVDATGSAVTGFTVGDRVLALGTAGGFSTHFTCNATQAHKIPDEMPFDEAAAFMLTYGTSYYALQECAELRAGESLFILGAAGGVGAAAIELGKVVGGRVIAGVSSPDKAEFCRELGADDVLIYPRELNKEGQRELSQQIKSLTGGEGVDVVYDAVGGDYAEPALRGIAWNGRFLVVGFPAGIPKIPLNLALLKGCRIIGVFWGGFTTRSPERFQQHVNELFTLYNAGKVKPHISAHFPLEQAAEALRMIQDRKVMGKVVLTMS